MAGVFEIERQALDAVADRLGDAFQQACRAIDSRGRVVATGMEQVRRCRAQDRRSNT